MTEAQIKRMVKTWQRLLNLPQWRVEVKFSTEGIDADSSAECSRDADYEHAIITFNSARFPSWDELYAEEVVVHELLHCVERETFDVFRSLKGVVSDDAYSLLSHRYDHAAEFVVDHVALAFVQLRRSLYA